MLLSYNQKNLYVFNMCFSGIKQHKILFDKLLPKDYLKNLQPKWKHIPVFGIYNASMNVIVGVGLGRKDELFITSSDGTINNRDKMKKFLKDDEHNNVSNMIDLLKRIGDLHYQSIEDVDFDTSEMNEAIEDLRSWIPTLPEDIGDISPNDF